MQNDTQNCPIAQFYVNKTTLHKFVNINIPI